MKNYFLMFKNAFNFSGLVSRKDFWLTILEDVIAWLAIFIFAIFGVTVYQIALIAYFCISFVPRLSLCVRRLHDTDRSGYNMFWVLFPVAGLVILAVYLCGKTEYTYYLVEAEQESKKNNSGAQAVGGAGVTDITSENAEKPEQTAGSEPANKAQ